MRIKNRWELKIIAGIILISSFGYFINKAYLEIIKSGIIRGVTMGDNNLKTMLVTLAVFVFGIISLKYLYKKVNLKTTVYEFIFLTIQIIITALAGLMILVNIKSSPTSTNLDSWGRYVYFMCITLFLFIIVKTLKDIILKPQENLS